MPSLCDLCLKWSEVFKPLSEAPSEWARCEPAPSELLSPQLLVLPSSKQNEAQVQELLLPCHSIVYSSSVNLCTQNSSLLINTSLTQVVHGPELITLWILVVNLYQILESFWLLCVLCCCKLGLGHLERSVCDRVDLDRTSKTKIIALPTLHETSPTAQIKAFKQQNSS